MILFWKSIYLCVIILDVISSYKIVDSNIAVTKYGRVLGTKLQSRFGSDFYAFRGLPYAKPPVRNLRFKVCFLENLVVKFQKNFSNIFN